jgi:hypothetical protein
VIVAIGMFDYYATFGGEPQQLVPLLPIRPALLPQLMKVGTPLSQHSR